MTENFATGDAITLVGEPFKIGKVWRHESENSAFDSSRDEALYELLDPDTNHAVGIAAYDSDLEAA